MKIIRNYSRNLYRESLAMARSGHMPQRNRGPVLPPRVTAKPKEQEEEPTFPRRVFSGIQPTGSLHLGNYLGAVQKWTAMQNAKEDVMLCIVDLHSITLPQDPEQLREQIVQMAATLLACGIDPHKSTLFVQSAVKEHTELAWILNCQSTMARLGHLPQYKEKTRMLKDIPLGLFVYPVLQAADIMLYKSTHVPVGEDQVQHIQLTQHLSKTFNTKYGTTFPICHAVIDVDHAARIRSLRDPSKKMSKSDGDPHSTINLNDEPEVITEKIKRALTDFTSDVSYEPINRAGVSNLVAIHSLVTGQKIDSIIEESKALDTGKYKLRVAEAVIEHLNPIRNKIKQYLAKRNDLSAYLDIGADKARQRAQQTMAEVRQKMGLGVPQSTHSMLSDIKLGVANLDLTKTQLSKPQQQQPHQHQHPHLQQQQQQQQQQQELSREETPKVLTKLPVIVKPPLASPASDEASKDASASDVKEPQVKQKEVKL